MLKWFVSGLMLMLTVASVAATGEISCKGKDLGVELLVGSIDVLSVQRVVVTLGDKTWSTTPETWPGQPITLGQAFEDDRFLMVDVMSDGMGEIIGKLRISKATEADTSAAGGTFTFKGFGAFVVDCSEPE